MVAARAPTVAADHDNADPMIGQVLDGRYRLTAKLGEGGMGQVYAAEHVHIEKRVAVKLLRSEIVSNEEAVTRFRQEARSASSIGHKNIIAIDDFGQLPDKRIYMCMEFLVGQPLNEMIKRPLEVERALHILIQTGHGLAAAHRKGIVHRDMKPENVFVTRQDGQDVPKLLDFGIAKVAGNEGNNHLTRTGTIFGTPFYMAPEQALGQAVDHRADIYAVGVIMYEVFCGTVPFKADSFMAILTQHITTEPVPPKQAAAANGRLLPPGLDDIILRCMRKDPKDRYGTMDELVQALVEMYRAVAGSGMSGYYDTVAASGPMSGRHPRPTPSPAGSGTAPPHVTGGAPAPTQSGAVPRGSVSMPGRAWPAPDEAPLDLERPARGRGRAVALVALLLVAGAAVGGYVLWSRGQQGAAAQAQASNDDSTTRPASGGERPVVATPQPGTGGDKPSTVVTPAASPDAAPAADKPAAGDGDGDAGDDDGPRDKPPAVQVTVLVNSRPQGANVYAGATRLGRTPLNVDVTQGEVVSLRLERRGFADAQVNLDGKQRKITQRLERRQGGGPVRPDPGPPPPTGDTPTPDPDPPVDTGTDKPDPDKDKDKIEDGLIDDDSDILE
jgi:serine/threonine-protein kinase